MSRLMNINSHTDGVEISDEDMNALEDWCADAENEGSHYPGMTYEQGIRDILEWLSGESGVAPHE